MLFLLFVAVTVCIRFDQLHIHRESYGDHHQKYADTLLDYGFFLSNVDEIAHAVHQYTVNIK